MPPIEPTALKHLLAKAGFRHTCFISWPHAQKRKYHRLLRKLKEAIERDAGDYGLPASVFIDWGMPPGVNWKAEMPQALLQSVVMVAICGPDYYESDWCGREWAGMQGLGESRIGANEAILPLLFQPARSDSTKGLVQLDMLPPPVQALNCSFDLSRLHLSGMAYERSRAFDDLVQQILRRAVTVAESLVKEHVTITGREKFELPVESAFAGFRQASQLSPLLLAPSVATGVDETDDLESHAIGHSVGNQPFDSGIVTFYSFKGGVGRSMAVANVGRLLARRGGIKPTLLIDWDLEAPGLHRYFRGVRSDRGLIDYFEALAHGLATRGDFCEALRTRSDRAQFLNQEIPVVDYLVESGAPGLWLMTAGATDADSMGEYQRRVGGFDWAGLFGRFPFAVAAFREMLSSKFRYCVIDSRTGVSDTAAICTAVLPERLVAVFGPNKQNEAILKVVEAAAEFRRLSEDGRPLVVFPAPSHFDAADLAGLQISLKTFRNHFSRLLKQLYGLTEADLTQYFDEVLLLYVPHYSYGEKIVVDQQEPSYAGSLRRGYESLERWLVQRVGPWALSDRPSDPS